MKACLALSQYDSNEMMGYDPRWTVEWERNEINGKKVGGMKEGRCSFSSFCSR